MRLRILGPVELRRPSGDVVRVRTRSRLLLGVLALRADCAVHVEWLLECLWPTVPPRSAAVNLRSYVAELRRSFAGLGADGPRVESGRGSYRLVVGRDGLDASVFESLAAEGRRLLDEGRPQAAVERLTAALDLWRGEVLEGLSVPELVRPAVAGLDDRRADVLESVVAAQLDLGQHVELAAELRALTDRYPLREQLWVQRMLALYRCARQAEAIEAYHELHRLLDDELGVAPCEPVHELYERIVRADPALRLPTHAVVHRPRPWQAPRQLPADVTAFVGRTPHLAALNGLSARGDGRTAVPVVVITGTAGVGKTALAVHWAHRNSASFPDGCLHVDLRGYGPDEPLPPAEALAGFLRAVGLDGAQLPAAQDELAALFRSTLADRRLLIVLDNARDAAQVRPLLPGTPHCSVLVTSRNDLAGLVARDGAQRLAVDLLPAADAVALLRTLIGARVDPHGSAAAELAESCARLPLALRIAAEMAGRRAEASIADLVAELAGRQRRLDRLDAGGDASTAVRAVFGWSYQALEPGLARAFALLGLHPGRDTDQHAAAALLGVTPPQARRLLDGLVQASLLHEGNGGRYAMHDLLRGYAAELAATHPDPDRRSALTRLLDHYQSAATAAADAAFGFPPATTGTTPASEARAWLDAERPNLVAAVVHAARNGWPGHAMTLSTTLWPYLDAGAHHRDAATVHEHARRAAVDSGDSLGEASASGRIGICHERMGQYREALDQLSASLAAKRTMGDRLGEANTLNATAVVHLRLGSSVTAAELLHGALAAYRQVGEAEGEGAVLSNLSIASYRLGRYREALDYTTQALLVSRRIGDRAVEGWTLGVAGLVHVRLGRHADAVEHVQHALQILRQAGHRMSEALALGILGVARTRMGRYRDALDDLEQALRLHRDCGNNAGEADALTGLGNLHRALGRPDRARTCHEEALAIDRELGERFQEAGTLNDLALTLRALRRADDAMEHHRSAIALARDIDDPYEQARGLDGLGHGYDDAGHPDRAAECWRAALDGYTALGVPEADQLAADLARITCSTGWPAGR